MSKKKELEAILLIALKTQFDLPHWYNYPNMSNYCFNRPKNGMQLDIAWPEFKVGIEINGGQWAKGKMGHNSGKGLERDARKLNDAQLKGWFLIVLVTDHIEKSCETYTLPLIREVLLSRGAPLQDFESLAQELLEEKIEL